MSLGAAVDVVAVADVVDAFVVVVAVALNVARFFIKAQMRFDFGRCYFLLRREISPQVVVVCHRSNVL